MALSAHLLKYGEAEIFNLVKLQKVMPPLAITRCQACNKYYRSLCNSASLASHNVFGYYCTQTVSSQKMKDVAKNGSKTNNGFGPSKIEELKTNLSQSVRLMFVKSYDYRLLHKDVVLENNFFGKNSISTGSLLYAVELLKLRFYLHYHHPDVSVKINEADVLDSDNLIIRVHWTLSAVPQRHVVKFWRFLKGQPVIDNQDFQIINGFSDFHIGYDGLVRKHRLDRVV